MAQYPKYLLKALIEREQKGLLRKLNTKFPEIDFCSNDYLGFSRNGLITQKLKTNLFENKLFGSTGSRLISGNSQFIEDTEKQIALFHHAEAALFFNSGYDANIGLLSSVPQKTDLILYDELIHASLHDGIRLSHAKHFKFKHNSISSLKKLLALHQKNFENIFVVTESVFSMDGDTAPLQDLTEICQTDKNIFLIVDEAHAIGVFGNQGRGLCNALGVENKIFARVYTYGKAMGCHGAAIVGNGILKNYLINFSRSFIYTTAPPYHSVEAVLHAYQLLIETNEKDTLQNNIAYLSAKAGKIKNYNNSQSAISCFITGSNNAADRLEKELAQKNIYAKAIKSPTVKEGTERVRFCLHSYNTKQEIDLLVEILEGFKK
ncbi:MAG: 8-amino-7-oxononanoate synthase [Bacteroidetes bacterium]|nr:8-amino-7-oxononanoate synthase [Bacteroidota bacterium]